MRQLLKLTPVLASLLLPASALAQIRSPLLSDRAVRPLGLTRAWFTQVDVDSGRSKVTFVTPFVSNVNAYTLYQVVWEAGKAEFSERDLDTFRKPIGKEGALEAANKKLDEVKKMGFDPKLITEVVPEVTLYVATDRGVIHAIDGETGKTRWARQVGRAEHPNLEPGLNEQYLGVVNGSHLLLIERDTGKLVWERTLGGAPGAGPALSNEYIFVPRVDGHIEVYHLGTTKDTEKEEMKRRFRPPEYHVSVGRPLIQPICTPYTCAWPTDRGFVYVADADKMGLRFRSQANDTIVAPVTYVPKHNMLVFVSVDGYMYAVHENSGDLLWRFSAGTAIISPAVAIEDGLYVTTQDGGMFKVDAATGLEMWWTPRVRRFLAASKNRVYCTDTLDRLTVIDAKNGGILGAVPTGQLDLLISNHSTDRIYVGTKTGLLQCLHEPQLERPLIYEGPGSEPEVTTQVKVGKPGAGGGGLDGAAGDSDPFATGGAAGGGTPATPAGGGSTPAADPFSNPFGGGAAGGAGGGATPGGGAGGGGGAGDDPFKSPF